MTAALAIVGSLVVVVGIVGVLLRSAKSDLAASAPTIAKQNEAFQVVGKELGLVFVPSETYGELRGRIGSVGVTVRFGFESLVYAMQIRVVGPKHLADNLTAKLPDSKVRVIGDELVVEPRIVKEKHGKLWHYVIVDPAVLRRWIEDAVSVVAKS
ncbi:MAG: hypothetical protein ACKV2T_07030 [Kofleriaceae bacterium]